MPHQILLIDDDETVRIEIGQYLRNGGYDVRTAETGRDALAILATEEIDLVVLDLNLPGGGSLEIEKKIQRDHSIPVIVVARHEGDEDKLLALGLGASGYLTKPLEAKEVLFRVRNMLAFAADGGEAVAPGPPADAKAIEKAISGKVHDFVEQTRARDAAGAAKRRRLGILAGALALIAAGGGLGVYLNPATPPGPAPASREAPPAPAPQPGPKAAAGPQAQQPAHAGTVEDIEEEPVMSVADVMGYGWVLKSKCEPVPDVPWWKNKTHEALVSYVYRKHDGDWKPYINSWFRRLLRLQEIHSRDSAAVTRTGVRLEGDVLAAYIKQMQTRLRVTRCLAREARAQASKKSK